MNSKEDATATKLRQSLPYLETRTFLNYAATAPALNECVEFMRDLVQQNTHALRDHFEQWLSILESSRRLTANLIGAGSDDIAFTSNTSTALSLIAGAIRWKEGDRVIFPSDEFPSNRYVWQNLKEFNVLAKEVEPQANLSFADQLQAMNLEKVRLVTFSAVSYSDGRTQDIKRICDICHSKKILVAVDGIQMIGVAPFNVKELGCDFVASGGQKWLLGPVGLGFLYVDAHLWNDLHVPTLGWASSRDAGNFEVKNLEFCAGARRLEAGLPDIICIGGFGRSLDFLSQLGWENIFANIASKQALCAELASNLGIKILKHAPSFGPSGIVTLDFETESKANEIFLLCEKNRVIVTHRGTHIRIAIHASCSHEEIGGFFDIVGRFYKQKKTSNQAKRNPPPVYLKKENSRALAIVTGASHGLGEALSTSLAQRGFEILLVGRQKSSLEKIQAKLSDSGWGTHQIAPLDLSSIEELSSWIKSQQHNLPRCKLLVNNAALANANLFVDETPENLIKTFNTNVFSAMQLTLSVLPAMKSKKNGYILNVVTSGSRCSLPLFSIYSASKAALWAWSEALGRELGADGISVLSFLPPHMDTATSRNLGRKAVGFFSIDGGGEKKIDPFIVATQALDALFAGQKTLAPFPVRLKHALNSLWPEYIEKKIRAQWKG